MKVFVVAWVGADNLGDELIFATLLAQLRRRGVAEVCVTSLRPSATEARFGVRAVGTNDALGLVRELRAADLVVFGGGGLLQDRTSRWSPLEHLSKLVLARRIGVPVIALGLGAGPLSSRVNRRLTGRVLGGAEAVIARDRASVELLRQCGVHAELGVDLVLDPPEAAPRPSRSAEQVLVCLRPPIASAPRWRRAAMDTPDEHAWLTAALAAQLDRVHRDTELPIRMLSFEPRRDEAFHRRVARAMSVDADIVPADADVEAELARSAVVIAMRYHGVALALRQGVPVVGLAYLGKVASLMEEAGLAHACLDLDPDGVGRLAEAVQVRLGGQEGPARLDGLQPRSGRNWAALDRALLSRGSG